MPGGRTRRTAEALAEVGIRSKNADGNTVYRSVGCGRLPSTPAINGRVAIFELMILDDDIRNLAIGQSVDSKTIKRASGGATACTRSEADGARKVLDGVTSIDEVLRATEEEGIVAEA